MKKRAKESENFSIIGAVHVIADTSQGKELYRWLAQKILKKAELVNPDFRIGLYINISKH